MHSLRAELREKYIMLRSRRWLCGDVCGVRSVPITAKQLTACSSCRVKEAGCRTIRSLDLGHGKRRQGWRQAG
eukprot:6328817-Alexandrium_andersonii.AAC.1